MNAKKEQSFVEINAEVENTRTTLWWFMVIIFVLLSGGFALGYIFYSLVFVPKTAELQRRTESLLTNVLNVVELKCDES